MITCVIEYEIDPYKRAEFEAYSRVWGQAIPRCGADLIGYFAPHEGSTTRAYGIYSLESLAAYEAYRLWVMKHTLTHVQARVRGALVRRGWAAERLRR